MKAKHTQFKNALVKVKVTAWMGGKFFIFEIMKIVMRVRLKIPRNTTTMFDVPRLEVHRKVFA